MFTANFKKKIIPITMLALFSSCEDGLGHDHDEHTDAEGMVLEIDGIEVYKELEGEIIVNSLNLTAGSMMDLSVHFLDNDGDKIEYHDDDGGDEGGLGFSVSDTTIISAEAEEHADDDHHHELEFELTGLSAGTTTFTVSLMHDGHADYTSLPIGVQVD